MTPLSLLDGDTLPDRLYRYQEVYTEEGLRLELKEFQVQKGTPCGYWIIDPWSVKFKRFVSKQSRKRFAYANKEEALESYKHRKKRQISILESQLSCAKIGLDLANNQQFGIYHPYDSFTLT